METPPETQGEAHAPSRPI